MRTLLWSIPVFLAACSSSETDVHSSVGACELVDVDAVCDAPTEQVTANASIALAPEVSAGITYEIDGPANGKRGFVVFTPAISGEHTLYFGDQEPVRVCDVEPTCGSPVTHCAPFHRAAKYEMIAGLPHEIEVRPASKDLVLHIAAPEAPPGTGGVKLAAAQIIQVAPYPWMLTPADLDGDQDLDLVVSNSNDAGGIASIVLVRGSGTGQFAAAREMQTSVPDDTVVHDWSGDGIPDIAGIAHDGQGPLPTFFFESIGPFLYDDSVRWGGGRDFLPSLSSGDFDEDGVPDLVAAQVDTVNFPDGPNGFLIFTMPGFTLADEEEAYGTGTTAAIAGDFDGDDNQDVLVADRVIGRVQLYTGDGTGNVTFATERPMTDSGVLAIRAFDLDGDGADDYVATFTDGLAMVVLGNGFTSRQTLDGTNHERGIAAGDFDRDGRTDLAITVRTPGTDDYFVQMYLGSAAGFVLGPQLALPTLAGSDLEAADFTGDGFVDLVATTPGGLAVFASTP